MEDSHTQQLTELQQAMNTKGWEVLVNHLVKQLEQDMISLASLKREGPSDDFLRGRIDVYRFFLKALPEQIEEHFRENAARKEAAREDDPHGHPYGGSTPNGSGQPAVEETL